jgi:toxin ParE1/3/4
VSKQTFPDIRRWHIEGFAKHLVLYREIAAGVEIVRILHAERDVAAILGEGLL